MKKVILIGATGILGDLLLTHLKAYQDLTIVTVSRTGQTDIHADIARIDDVRRIYESVQTFDAVINVAGHCWIGPFNTMTEDDWYFGIRNKMMSQINLVMIGKDYINTGGSFTLTSGFLSDDPLKDTINYSIANGGIDNFVLAAARELKHDIRINAVSPGLVLKDYDGRMDGPATGQLPVSHTTLVHAYYKSAFGHLTGQVYRVWEGSTQYVRK